MSLEVPIFLFDFNCDRREDEGIEGTREAPVQVSLGRLQSRSRQTTLRLSSTGLKGEVPIFLFDFNCDRREEEGIEGTREAQGQVSLGRLRSRQTTVRLSSTGLKGQVPIFLFDFNCDGREEEGIEGTREAPG